MLSFFLDAIENHFSQFHDFFLTHHVFFLSFLTALILNVIHAHFQNHDGLVQLLYLFIFVFFHFFYFYFFFLFFLHTPRSIPYNPRCKHRKPISILKHNSFLIKRPSILYTNKNHKITTKNNKKIQYLLLSTCIYKMERVLFGFCVLFLYLCYIFVFVFCVLRFVFLFDHKQKKTHKQTH